MGKGNYLFRDSLNQPINTYYIECDEEQEEFFLEDFKENLNEICKRLKLDRLVGKTFISSWNNWETILAENGVFELRSADNEWSAAIACVPKLMENTGHVNPMWKKSANKLMIELHKIYGLHKRGGAWTSGDVDDKFKDFY